MQKKIKLIIIISFLFVILNTTISQAFQSVYNDLNWKIDTPGNWIKNIRNMESENNVLGLKEEINASTLEANGEANDIDIHLVKNTEYGAMAILSASQYGKQPMPNDTTEEQTSRYVVGGENLSTTTGNKYGIYMPNSWLWTASEKGVFFSTTIARKYINEYTASNSSAKVGDAMVETAGWHNSDCRYWPDESRDGVARGPYDEYGIFSYSRCYYTTISGYTYACITNGNEI